MIDERLYDLETFKSTVDLMFGAWMRHHNGFDPYDEAAKFLVAHEYLDDFWTYHEIDSVATLENLHEKWFLANGGKINRR